MWQSRAAVKAAAVTQATETEELRTAEYFRREDGEVLAAALEALNVDVGRFCPDHDTHKRTHARTCRSR